MFIPLTISPWKLINLSLIEGLSRVLAFLIGEGIGSASSTPGWFFLKNPSLLFYYIFPGCLLKLLSPIFLGDWKFCIELLPCCLWYTGELSSFDDDSVRLSIYLISPPTREVLPPLCSKSFPSLLILIWNISIHSILFCGSLVKILLRSFFVSFETLTSGGNYS